MPTYRVEANQVYYNAALGTYEGGLLLGDSQLQHGDSFVAEPAQVADALAAGAVVLVA